MLMLIDAFVLAAKAKKSAKHAVVVPPPTPIVDPMLIGTVAACIVGVLALLYMLTRTKSQSTYPPAQAKGGCEIVPGKTALVAIEFQNEFVAQGGKLHPAVKDVMASTNMLAKVRRSAEQVRDAGGKVIHCPLMFKADASDNPNKALGILAGCAKDRLFTEKTWNAEFCKEMTPMPGDIVVHGKKGLDAFPNTNLEKFLVAHGIETVALCGFLTNCCVESTMRTACEKGFNVITLTDGCATVAKEAQEASCGGTFGMFSTPMTVAEFGRKIAPTPPTLAEVGMTPSQRSVKF